MKFTIKQEALKVALAFIAGIVGRDWNSIPALNYFLLETVGNSEIKLTSTDLDVSIICRAEAEIENAGAVCMPARKLSDIVRLLPSAEINFIADDNGWVKVSCLNSIFRVPGMYEDRFPEIPKFKSAPMALPAHIFQYLIRHTSFVITHEQSRFTLSGAKFEVSDGTVRMITTDGHRLAYVEKSNLGLEAPDGNLNCLIPRKAVNELLKLIQTPDSIIGFGEDSNHIFFDVEGRQLITRKLTGSFPNYKMVMPKDNDKTAIFNCDEMKRALARIMVMADARNRAFRLHIGNNEFSTSAQTAEDGEANETVNADVQVDGDLTIGFNGRYLADFLKVASGEDLFDEAENEPENKKTQNKEVLIEMKFKDANSQTEMTIIDQKGYDYRYVVMPLRM
jgi:DNA polymerase-3 subunit beta